MIRIAVCDDMQQDLQSIALQIDQYLSAKNLVAEVMLFSHPDALMKAIRTGSFHIYILDIVMPMVNGLELGKEIRRLDHETQIIFVTTEPQFALQAYSAFPINYLIKPVDKQQLFDTLTLAISRIDTAEEHTFTVKTTDSVRVVKLSDIACCEYHNHKVTFTMISGEELISCTIRKNYSEYILPILKDKHFLQCHTSFVVNMRRVEYFEKNRFTLFGGKIVPIAAKQYTVVRDSYLNYLMAKGDLL